MDGCCFFLNTSQKTEIILIGMDILDPKNTAKFGSNHPAVQRSRSHLIAVWVSLLTEIPVVKSCFFQLNRIWKIKSFLCIIHLETVTYFFLSAAWKTLLNYNKHNMQVLTVAKLVLGLIFFKIYF